MALTIIVHQAYYGEVDRSHGCIIQTISDTELTSNLISFTDRPGALIPGVDLAPYISGEAFGKYYVFSKTFPDYTAKRSGMVFTHLLIIGAEDLKLIDLNSILSIFITQGAYLLDYYRTCNSRLNKRARLYCLCK